MDYRRMPIEIESPEQLGYDQIECNLAESSVSDIKLGSYLSDKMNSLVLCYGDHVGLPELRQMIARDYKNLDSGNVLLTAGASSALFIIYTSILKRGDKVMITFPNYSTNLEIPRSLGAESYTVKLSFDKKFALNAMMIENSFEKDTKIISLTTPHNPTGAVIEAEELNKIITFAEKHKCYVLLDETYRYLQNENLTVHNNSPYLISVSSVSKAFGVPGIRIGWIASSNNALMELFLAAKEQIFICNSVVDEHIALEVMKFKNEILEKILPEINLKKELVKSWMNKQAELEWIEPGAGVVCFPRFKETSDVDPEQFYMHLLTQYKTMVGPGHWFDMDKRYFRLGYGWPGFEELEKGLNNISKTINDLKK